MKLILISLILSNQPLQLVEVPVTAKAEQVCAKEGGCLLVTKESLKILHIKSFNEGIESHRVVCGV